MAKKNKQARQAFPATPVDPGNDYVKKSTMLVVMFLALLAGGFIGSAVILSSRQDAPAQAQAAEAQSPEPSPQDLQLIASLEQQTKNDPTNLRAWTDLGNLYFDSDQPAKSVAAYQKALDLAPSNANVWTDMGVMQRRLGQFNKAVESFDRAIMAEPAHQNARFNKGVVLLYDLHDAAGALAAWEGLLKVVPSASSPSGQPVSEMVAQLKADMATQGAAQASAATSPTAQAAQAPQSSPGQQGGKPALYLGN